MASLVKTILISLAMLGGGILVLKEYEKKQITCTGGQVKNASGQCACPTGQTLQAGVCKAKPVTPPANNNNNNNDNEDEDDEDDEEEEDECPAAADRACDAQENAYGTNYTCSVNPNTCTCVCQRKANRAVVNVNRVMTNDYYNNRMDYYDYKNKIYQFDKDDDYRYKALPAFADPGGDPLYAYNPDGNTLPFFRDGSLSMNGNLRFANVVG